ncbi:interferon-induced protein 44-like [Mytilus californianus]|uniref:interferon-induced protein 44-like n=1 Tax=Mytilus californianus TaxID=6549 RepID=UPI002248074F|nr:interferon-induced protein 44-like [Mytilus californianus]
MAVEFKKRDQTRMNQWLGGNKRYTCLFKASRDGCNSTTFHNLCNNKGPTVTIMYNTNNSVYGAYTSVSWASTEGWRVDGHAFLFRLYQSGNWKPVKLPVKNTNYSTYDVSSYGPTFGGGHDLPTFNSTINPSSGYFQFNIAAGTFGHSYSTNGETLESITNGNRNMRDIEVYLVEVSDKPTNAPLEAPWRNTPQWNTELFEALKEKIDKYTPLKELKVPQARVLLIGQVGAGKTSFFNTINSVFRGYITRQACSGNAEHSLTTVYRMYQIRNSVSGKPLNFRLHDTRGLEADQGMDAHGMSYLLDGNLPDRFQFNPSAPVTPDITGFVAIPQLADKIHCVVFVIDGSTVDVMPEKVIEKMKGFQIHMNQRGIPQIVLLTKIDKVCEATSEDLSQIFFSPVVQESVDRVSQILGLPRSNILPIKNYESEIELHANVNILTLLTLQQILNSADDYMYNYLDKIEDGKLQQLNIRE